MSEPQEVTQLLLDWRAGKPGALDRLTPHVYQELHRLASRYMRRERRDHTLQTTALLHEAYARLIHADVPWQDRVHFYAVAARAMRQILVDHAKARRSAKRGKGQAPLPLDEGLVVASAPSTDVVELDEALKSLSRLDDRKSRIVELHYFGGLSYDEIAAAMEVSRSTVKRELRLARAFLRRELSRDDDDANGETT